MMHAKKVKRRSYKPGLPTVIEDDDRDSEEESTSFHSAIAARAGIEDDNSGADFNLVPYLCRDRSMNRKSTQFCSWICCEVSNVD